jgi:hypothetical protein
MLMSTNGSLPIKWMAAFRFMDRPKYMILNPVKVDFKLV